MKAIVTLSKIGETFPALTDELLTDGQSVFGYFDVSDYIPVTDPRHESYRGGLADKIEVADSVYMTQSAATSQLGVYASSICKIDNVSVNIIPEKAIQ